MNVKMSFTHVCIYNWFYSSYFVPNESLKNNYMYMSLNVLEKSLNLRIKFLYEPWTVAAVRSAGQEEGREAGLQTGYRLPGLLPCPRTQERWVTVTCTGLEYFTLTIL